MWWKNLLLVAASSPIHKEFTTKMTSSFKVSVYSNRIAAYSFWYIGQEILFYHYYTCRNVGVGQGGWLYVGLKLIPKTNLLPFHVLPLNENLNDFFGFSQRQTICVFLDDRMIGNR